MSWGDSVNYRKKPRTARARRGTGAPIPGLHPVFGGLMAAAHAGTDSLDGARAAFYASCDSVEDYDERFEELFVECGQEGGERAMMANKLYTIAALLKGLRMLKGALCMRDIFALSWEDPDSSSSSSPHRDRRSMAPTHPYERESRKVRVLRQVFDDCVHRPRFEAAVAEAVDRYANPFGPFCLANAMAGAPLPQGGGGCDTEKVKAECHRNELLAAEYMELHQLWTTLVVCPLPDRRHEWGVPEPC